MEILSLNVLKKCRILATITILLGKMLTKKSLMGFFVLGQRDLPYINIKNVAKYFGNTVKYNIYINEY